MKTTVQTQIRWMLRRDMFTVLRIEAGSFDRPWSEEDFMYTLRQQTVIGMVAEYCDEVVGFMIYELFKTRLHVLNFAVAPWARRVSVGAQMIEKLVNKLSHQRRRSIVLDVRETNLPAQLFFRRMGFRAVYVQRDAYQDTDEAAYRMEFRLDGEPEAYAPVNRIGRLAGGDESCCAGS